MKFITKIKLEKSSICLNHCQRVLTIGSCFAENIGIKIKNLNISTLINPFGITYNPVSVESCIKKIINKGNIKKEELQSCQDIFAHFDFHGRFNHVERGFAATKMNEAIDNAHQFIHRPLDTLIITLGTAYVHRHKKLKQIVNNCHKIPASNFELELLSNDTIIQSITQSIQLLKVIQPKLQTIVTISPVRHIKTGLVENQLSKSKLIQCAHEIVGTEANVSYFPSYEIMIDELREYRFYNDDMVHPSPLATNYIWEKFQQTFFDEESLEYAENLEAFNKMMNHKLLHPHAKSSKDFIDLLTKKAHALKERYPRLNMERELHEIKLKKNLG